MVSMMECNKDEAVRAKEIAERKMRCEDFIGAQKIAKKAQGLFPELENISQLITVCDVHCSAQSKLSSSEMDWYGILQVQSHADEVAIRKQYRKLALLLHPDKNKFPGAEAAFKLIGQANMVLSDHGKRALYDSKCRVSVRTTAEKPRSHHSSSFNDLGVFWTSCPFCFMRYQYQKDFVNRVLLCQNCSARFTAYNIGAQAAPQQKQFPSQGSFKMESQGAGAFPFPNSKGNSNQEKKRTQPGMTNAAGVGGISSSKGKKHGKVGFGSEKVDHVNNTSKNTPKKRRRKSAAESSGSFDTASSAGIDENIAQQNGRGFFTNNPGLNEDHPRRSSRKKDHVSYKENIPEDDSLGSPPKQSKTSGSCKDSAGADNGNGVSKADVDSGLDRKKDNLKQEGNVPPGETSLDKGAGAGKHKVNGAEASQDDDSKSDSECSPPSPTFYEVPEPEFNDFDKDKAENCFSVGQIWACYDTVDGMPRFYARVKKVLSPSFKLQITWLEPHPSDESEVKWCDEGLPFGCGNFRLEETEETTDRLSFSHQVLHFMKGGRLAYKIYPTKGETWALFKDWDVSWSSEPEDRKFNYEFVEVISDLIDGLGISVAYLEKVEGFVSVFQKRVTAHGVIPHSQLLRFSHQIPSFILTGNESDGIPKGSLELDPAAIPNMFGETCTSDGVKKDHTKVDAEVKCTIPDFFSKVAQPNKTSVNFSTPKKNAGCAEKNNVGNDIFKPRRSPRKQ